MIIKYPRHVRMSEKPNFIIVSRNYFYYYMDTLLTADKIYDLGMWKIKYKN